MQLYENSDCEFALASLQIGETVEYISKGFFAVVDGAARQTWKVKTAEGKAGYCFSEFLERNDDNMPAEIAGEGGIVTQATAVAPKPVPDRNVATAESYLGHPASSSQHKGANGVTIHNTINVPPQPAMHGHYQASSGNPHGDRSRAAALLLCIFLGSGIHRFYLGKVGTGILQLILAIPAWVGFAFPPAWVFAIPYFIWVFVDFIRIITKSISPRLR